MELWTVDDAAHYLKMHPDSVRRKVRERQMPHLRMGRWIRFRKEALDMWLEAGCPNQREQPTLFDT